MRSIALTPLLSLGLAGAALAAPKGALEIVDVRAAQPPHCMAAKQWADPLNGGPVDLFDGQADRPWVVCPEAAAAGDYAIDFTFAAPIQVDGVRIEPGPDAAQSPRVIELGFHNTRLSTQWPVYFRQTRLQGKAATVVFKGRLPWNPQLVNDESFHERRRAQDLDAMDVPLPLTVDKLTVVLRDVAPGQPVSLGEITFLFDDQPVKVANVGAARARHAAFLEQGLKHVLAKRFLVRDNAVIHLAGTGELIGAPLEAWENGEWLQASKKVGEWRIAAGRLEMKRNSAKEFTVVEYRVDEAPAVVALRSGPLAGEWRVSAGAPGTGPAAPKATAAADDAPAAIPLY
ncbi:MAG: hypothetical protein H6702_23255 [Myxococcales bacterium]|nr:hypothetical protein [Myxococcales bacterium]